MPITPWGYGGFGNGDDPRMQQPAAPAAVGGGAPAWGGGGGAMGMNPWLQGLAQRIAAARQAWQQRMHPGAGPGGGMGQPMQMPWMRGGPPQGVMPAQGAPPAAAGGGASAFAPGWSNRFAAPGAGQAQPAAAAATSAAPTKPAGDNAADGDADDEKKDD